MGNVVERDPLVTVGGPLPTFRKRFRNDRKRFRNETSELCKKHQLTEKKRALNTEI